MCPNVSAFRNDAASATATLTAVAAKVVYLGLGIGVGEWGSFQTSGQEGADGSRDSGGND